MRFYTYLVAWDDVHFNAVEVEQEFIKAGSPVTVINSGNMKRDHWDNVGDIRYYRQFYHALKSFDDSYDYMAFLCGDVSYSNWQDFINRARNVLESYSNIGLYAPHLTNEPWSERACKIGDISQDGGLNLSIQTDGIYVFIHKTIVKYLLDYFNYINDSITFDGMTSGWGLDMIWSSICINNGWAIVRDNKFILNHPAGSSYDHSKATSEMNTLLNEFYTFAKNSGDKADRIREIQGKIYGRMSHTDGCMNSSDFYGINLDLYKRDINYTVIHINDERKRNREVIKDLLNGHNLNIPALNARDDAEVNKFHEDNPEFKLAWDGFKPGELGNFASHYLAWKHLVNSNLNSLLVFEDDSLMHNDFVYKYNILINSVPRDYDVLSIFVDRNQYDRYASKDYVNNYVSKGYQDWSTLCYVISRQGAEKMIKYISEIGMDHPTDWFIFRKGHQGIFNVYTVPPEFPSPLEIDHSYASQVQ